MKEITPFSYRKSSSPLHRLPAGLKLAFLLLLSIMAFLPGPELRTFFFLVTLAFILVILSFVAGINPLALLRGSRPLLLIVLGIFLVQGVELSPLSFSASGIKEAIIFCVRIGIVFAAASLLFFTTSAGEIRKSLSRLESFLHLDRLKLSLHISLMLGFLPQFFRIWEDLNLAWKSRGGKNKPGRLVKLIPLLIEKMILKAAETADALEARGTK